MGEGGLEGGPTWPPTFTLEKFPIVEFPYVLFTFKNVHFHLGRMRTIFFFNPPPLMIYGRDHNKKTNVAGRALNDLRSNCFSSYRI